MKSTPPALPAVVANPHPTGIVAARATRGAADRMTAPAFRRPAGLGETGSLARPAGGGRRGGPLGRYVDTYA